MTRGKIQIKLIENVANRQVTYSKRRIGLFKKADELSVLCDAKVSIIMISSTKRVHEYISPNTSLKEMIDEYQKSLGVDLWNSHNEAMEENLRKLREVNRNLHLEISKRRLGEGLNDMNFKELRDLEVEMDDALSVIRERKIKVISNQIETTKKKKRNAKDINRRLLQDYEAREDDPHYGVVDNGGIDPNYVIGYTTGVAHHHVLDLRYSHKPPPALCSGPSALFSGDVSQITTYPLLN